MELKESKLKVELNEITGGFIRRYRDDYLARRMITRTKNKDGSVTEIMSGSSTIYPIQYSEDLVKSIGGDTTDIMDKIDILTPADYHQLEMALKKKFQDAGIT